jgi:hypothetical protein
MSRAEDALAVDQILLVQRDCLVESSGLLVAVGEVVPRGQCVRMIRAEHSFAVGKGALAETDAQSVSAAPQSWRRPTT